MLSGNEVKVLHDGPRSLEVVVLLNATASIERLLRNNKFMFVVRVDDEIVFCRQFSNRPKSVLKMLFSANDSPTDSPTIHDVSRIPLRMPFFEFKTSVSVPEPVFERLCEENTGFSPDEHLRDCARVKLATQLNAIVDLVSKKCKKVVVVHKMVDYPHHIRFDEEDGQERGMAAYQIVSVVGF